MEGLALVGSDWGDGTETAYGMSSFWWRSWEPIRTRAVERAVVITRVSVRDFDHGDQVHSLTLELWAVHSVRKAERVAG